MLLVRTRLALSAIHGIGLFADERIAKDTAVWRYMEGFDVRVEPEVVERMSPPAKEHLRIYAYRDPDEGYWELCSDDARFFNHSDAPNTVSVIGDDGVEVYVAARDIEPGVELTCDYRGFDPDWRRKVVEAEVT